MTREGVFALLLDDDWGVRFQQEHCADAEPRLINLKTAYGFS